MMAAQRVGEEEQLNQDLFDKYGVTLRTFKDTPPPNSQGQNEKLVQAAEFCCLQMGVYEDTETVQDAKMARVERLLHEGYSVNSVDHNGWTAAMHAARAGHLPLLTRLSSLPSFDPTLSDESGKTAGMWAAEGGHREALHLLMQAPTFDLDQPDSFGGTALVYAVVNGHTDIVQTLLRAGARQKVGMFGQSAQEAAAEEGHEEIAKMLETAYNGGFV
mmetsp:Transcript_72978/g.152384  ORF Transcript_72978/g.152384 Transcript_72978/m.152384 type:complete len:217 (+) Transcript_72978:116-766(+)